MNTCEIRLLKPLPKGMSAFGDREDQARFRQRHRDMIKKEIKETTCGTSVNT